jgi:lipopolysaccharide export system permease protein
MLGILFAFRKLATTSELDVMRAVGLSYTRLLRVPYLMTVRVDGAELRHRRLLAAARALLATSSSTSSCARARSAPSIKVGEFTQLEDRVALRIEQSRDEAAG